LEAVSSLLASFDAVSVREQSGVTICREALGREQCDLVLDPTLVVDPALYAEAAAPPRQKSRPSLVSYVLDRSDGSEVMRKAVEVALPETYETTLLSADADDRRPSLGQWLRAFMDADFVITDSYHGTIFAILFEKNFIAFGNADRGLDRFNTLLDGLGLMDRLVLDFDPTRIASLVKQAIEYEQVNYRLAAMRKASRDYLLSALGAGPEAADRPSLRIS
jgi:hypothetical protein